MHDAIAAYGTDMQEAIAIEEMAELTQALCKYKRCPSPATCAHVKEEMADVRIMMGQLDLIFGAPDSELIDGKLERLQQRIKRDTTFSA
jgi:NTP pyrophosphatase (non-canonical NTP hydrolase)